MIFDHSQVSPGGEVGSAAFVLAPSLRRQLRPLPALAGLSPRDYILYYVVLQVT